MIKLGQNEILDNLAERIFTEGKVSGSSQTHLGKTDVWGNCDRIVLRAYHVLGEPTETGLQLSGVFCSD
jgi:hypothetical protein